MNFSLAGYYADEEAGCQLFHVCDGNFLISSFLCPIGSIFSQKVLTCDWWNKVDCSLTKNYYTINSQTSGINDADDDDILRKAYEMTSHHATKNENINKKKNNEISSSNDLQTGPNNFPDYDKIPRLEYQQQKKFSSRYSAVDANDYYPNLPDDNSSNSAIKVHTIGEDYKNDVDNNRGRVRPSYMPTVPTVTTTKKTYYSPTVPTTTSRSMKYDLEFESSDHLYSARGKTIAKSTTITPNNYEIIDDKSSNIFDNLSTQIQGEESSNKNKILPTESALLDSKNDQISSPISLLKSLKENRDIKNSKEQNFIIREFENLDLGINSPEEVIKNYTKLVSLEEDNYQGDKNIFVPPTNIIPPFFYYSSIEQHNAVTDKTSEITETNSTTSWFDTVNIDVSVTDIIPPSFYYEKNEESNNKSSDEENLKSGDKFNKTDGENYSVIAGDFKTPQDLSREIVNSSNSGNNIESIFEVENSTERISTPSKIFLPPLFKFFVQNASGFLRNFQYDLNNIGKDSGENFDSETNSELSEEDDGKLVDSVEGESSPYRVTFNIAAIGGLDYNDDFSKSQSNSGDESHQERLENIKSQDTEVTDDENGPENGDDQFIGASRLRTVNFSPVNSSKSRGVPRPSSRFSSQEFGRKNSESTSAKSNIINPHFLSEKNNIPAGNRRGKSEPQRAEIKHRSSQTLGRADQSKDENINFNLPHLSRNFNFQSGSRRNPEIPVESEGGKISDKNKMGVEKSMEKSGESFRIETEVIPSLGFSLNTDEERKKFMDAIMKGLITDITIQSTNKSATSAGKL